MTVLRCNCNERSGSWSCENSLEPFERGNLNRCGGGFSLRVFGAFFASGTAPAGCYAILRTLQFSGPRRDEGGYALIAARSG
jgi:hypothetical protein